ncbi:replication protein [Alicyclobacillus sp. SO9]|uniref:replication protein n=1 Tax=Alicyclobacillus sp. SO9 TaxID=2665646 RepID=UPI0018E727C1|nr:replication protein [Alicyclobacillus sp. SO9]QQE81570.1 replication protein [Alicyclobacillus sp. SO9]
MASPQPTDSHTRISNQLYTQILMRDFTKRQRAILDLIIRLSYGCGHKTASIPLCRHFSICGVPANKVRGELNGLGKLRVIDWDADMYWINKDYDEWLIDPPDTEVEKDFAMLLKANIGRKPDQNGHAQNGQDDQKVQDDMTKTVSNSGPKRSCDLPSIPRDSKDEGVLITKDNYIDKKIISISNGKRNPSHDYLVEMLKYGNDLFAPYGISQATAHSMAELLMKEELPKELGQEALNVTNRLGKDEGFAVNKLRRWLQAGIKDVESAQQHETEAYGPKRENQANRNGGKDPYGTVSNQSDDRGRDGEDWAAIEAGFYK